MKPPWQPRWPTIVVAAGFGPSWRDGALAKTPSATGLRRSIRRAGTAGLASFGCLSAVLLPPLPATTDSLIFTESPFTITELAYPGWDHVGLEVGGWVIESHPGYDYRPTFPMVSGFCWNGTGWNLVAKVNGVHYQHSRGSFIWNSASSAQSGNSGCTSIPISLRFVVAGRPDGALAGEPLVFTLGTLGKPRWSTRRPGQPRRPVRQRAHLLSTVPPSYLSQNSNSAFQP